MPDIPKEVGIQKQLTEIHIDLWKGSVFLHPKWWLLILLLLLLIIVWWRVCDKSRAKEICLFAGLMTIISLGINEYGEELTLWEYPVDIIPVFPPLSSINLVALPLIYSIVHQHFKTWKGYIFSSFIASVLICFILEPVLSWLEFYRLLKWEYYLGVPLYFTASVCVRAAVGKIKKIERLKMVIR